MKMTAISATVRRCVGSGRPGGTWCHSITIGGRSAATLRVVAEHADRWNIPGSDIDDAVRRSALLDRFCAAIGRDPAAITRSIVLNQSSDENYMHYATNYVDFT